MCCRFDGNAVMVDGGRGKGKEVSGSPIDHGYSNCLDGNVC
jgi:hypothetical protein